MWKYSPIANSRDNTSATGCAQIIPISWKIAPRMNIAGIVDKSLMGDVDD